MTDKIRNKLLELLRHDERVRSQLAETGELFDGYHPEMERVHRRNARELREVFDDIGWPDEEKVGEDGCRAAWMIAQHAISMPDFQRRARDLLAEAVERGRAPAPMLAKMVDRIRFYEGRKQIYGTNRDWTADGVMAPTPIQDSENVDERRAEVGLPPLDAPTEPPSPDGGSGEQAPDDWEQRRSDFVAWCHDVGWRE